MDQFKRLTYFCRIHCKSSTIFGHFFHYNECVVVVGFSSLFLSNQHTRLVICSNLMIVLWHLVRINRILSCIQTMIWIEITTENTHTRTQSRGRERVIDVFRCRRGIVKRFRYTHAKPFNLRSKALKQKPTSNRSRKKNVLRMVLAKARCRFKFNLLLPLLLFPNQNPV